MKKFFTAENVGNNPLTPTQRDKSSYILCKSSRRNVNTVLSDPRTCWSPKKGGIRRDVIWPKTQNPQSTVNMDRSNSSKPKPQPTLRKSASNGKWSGLSAQTSPWFLFSSAILRTYCRQHFFIAPPTPRPHSFTFSVAYYLFCFTPALYSNRTFFLLDAFKWMFLIFYSRRVLESCGAFWEKLRTVLPHTSTESLKITRHFENLY